MSLVFVSVFREAYDRTKPTEEGRASALRGRLQSVDPTKLNNALAPRAAGRAEASLCALLLVLWRATRTGREKEVARFVRALRQRRCQRTPRLHLGAWLLPWDTTLRASLEGGTDPLGTCSRPMGGGMINRGGTLNRT